jgi:hypothetical protein
LAVEFGVANIAVARDRVKGVDRPMGCL